MNAQGQRKWFSDKQAGPEFIVPEHTYMMVGKKPTSTSNVREQRQDPQSKLANETCYTCEF